MVATEIGITELVMQASAQDRKQVLRALLKDLFARFGSKVPVKVLDDDGKLLSYVVPPGVKTRLPVLEDCPEEFEAEMQRRMADPVRYTPDEVEARIEKKYGPYTGEIPLPVPYHADGKTRTK
jgi:hypothetical protein